MTATAPPVAPAMEAPATPASSFALVSLVAAPLVLAGAALWVLADADRLDAAAIVRGLLVVAFAAAGRAAWRQPAFKGRLGVWRPGTSSPRGTRPPRPRCQPVRA